MYHERGLPEQNLSELGLDPEVIQMFSADLEGDAIYENAGMIAELIAEQTLKVTDTAGMEAVDLDQFNHYCHASVTQSADTPDSSVALRTVLHIMSLPTVSSQRNHSYEDGGFATYHTWAGSPRQLGAFVRRKLQYDDIVQSLQRELAEYRTDPQRYAVDDLSTLYDWLEGNVRSMRVLSANRTEGRYRRVWGENLSHVTNRNFDVTAGAEVQPDDIDIELDSMRSRLLCRRALEPISVEESETRRFGSKASHLLALQRGLQALAEAGSEVADSLYVPPFTTIGIDTYQKHKNGEDITQDLLYVLEWTTRHPGALVVRSSALIAEDGEHMGAGVYDSVVLKARPTLAELRQAVEAVYASANSELAIEYRQSAGLGDEQMGIIVQQFAGHEDAEMVTISSSMPNTPMLIDYRLEVGSHPLYRNGTGKEYILRHLPLSRPGMDLEFGTVGGKYDPQADRFHIPPDTRYHNTVDSWTAVQALGIAEHVLGATVQVELAFDGNRTALLQARPLPPGWLKEIPFEGFPETGELWYEGRGLGVINGEDAVVVTHMSEPEETLEAHPDSTVLIVQRSSFGHSKVVDEQYRRYLRLSDEQKARLVVLVEQSSLMRGSNFGHIETLMAEAGVRLICAVPEGSRGQPFVYGQRVNIYSDGFRARVYSSNDDPEVVARQQRDRAEAERIEKSLWDDDGNYIP